MWWNKNNDDNMSLSTAVAKRNPLLDARPSSKPSGLRFQFRLQVWHFTEYGRNLSDNEKLASWLNRIEPSRWFFEAAAPSNDFRDQYIPIEVDLWYCKRGRQDLDGDLRRLFKDAQKPLVKFFAEIDRVPHHMNVFPIGNTASDDSSRKRFTLMHALITLPLPPPPKVRRALNGKTDTMSDILRIAASVPRSAAVVKDVIEEMKKMPEMYFRDSMEKIATYFMVMPPADQNQDSGALTNREVWANVEKNIAGSEIGVALQARFGDDSKEPWATREIEDACNKCVHLFRCLQPAARDISAWLDKFSKQEIVSNQDLYETLINVCIAMNILAPLQDEMERALNLVLEKLKPDSKNSRELIGFAITLLILGGVCVATGGVAGALVGSSLAVGGAIGAKAGAVVAVAAGAAMTPTMVSDLRETKVKREDLENLQTMLPGIRKSLGDTHATLTTLFCQQAFGLRVSDMERHEQKTTLKCFGVDEDLLSNDIYRQELANDRLQKFSHDFGEFEDQCAKVVRQSGWPDIVVSE